MDQILKKSRNIKLQADKILSESGILEILKEYGEVKLAGSYALDVMLRPDIDIFVVTQTHDWEKAKKICNEIIESKYFREVDFVNWLDFSNESKVDIWTPSARGYYLRPIIPTKTELWKMDIWLITPEHDKSAERTDHYQKLLDEAGEEKRKIILEVKDAMRKGSGYIDKVDGKLIYQAVLENNVLNIEDFKKFLEKQTD